MTKKSTIRHPSFDALSAADVQFANEIISELRPFQWARPLIEQIPDVFRLENEYKARIFELNFAYGLHRCGISPTYEADGDGNSKIDFSFKSKNIEWFVELMRLNETAASKLATDGGENIVTRMLSTPHTNSNCDEIKQSIEGEMIKVIERILSKCIKNGNPHKFTIPTNKINAIFVDITNYCDGGDNYDKIQIAFGPDSIPPEYRMSFGGRPILGAFNARNATRNSHVFRERVHFIIFGSKYKFNPNAPVMLDFAASPHLFQSKEEVRVAFESFPLSPKRLL